MSHAIADTVSWWERTRGEDDLLVAYFSMEFGLHERLPIYSGGLGVLAGDHLKAAAELGVPLVGVGLLYRGGYFRQEIDADGRQTEDYQRVDPNAVGLVREPVTVTVELADETIEAAVWRKDVGSVPLYLLEVEWLTDALYSGDREHRIRQELLLGVGGVRALTALGIEPNVFHLNEGHSAFLQIERLRKLTSEGMQTADALEHVRRTSIFTTHTPVPAGNEEFDEELVVRYVGKLAETAGLDREALLELGRFGDKPGFGMTPLALRLSAYANGVSGSARRGGARDVVVAVARPGDADRSRDERRAHRHVARSLRSASCCGTAASCPEAPPDEANWGAARDASARRRSGVSTPQRRRAWPSAPAIDRDRLTIGFARRFATYKRAGLVFSDIERLLALPIQIVVAGKAHPADTPGKDVMQ